MPVKKDTQFEAENLRRVSLLMQQATLFQADKNELRKRLLLMSQLDERQQRQAKKLYEERLKFLTQNVKQVPHFKREITMLTRVLQVMERGETEKTISKKDKRSAQSLTQLFKSELQASSASNYRVGELMAKDTLSEDEKRHLRKSFLSMSESTPEQEKKAKELFKERLDFLTEIEMKTADNEAEITMLTRVLKVMDGKTVEMTTEDLESAESLLPKL